MSCLFVHFSFQKVLSIFNSLRFWAVLFHLEVGFIVLALELV